MAEEQNKETNTDTEQGLEIGSKADLVKLITDLQGQMNNMQEQVDKMAPVTEETEEEKPGSEGAEEKEPSKEEVDEVDALLQED